ncbi:MAG: hypothetical protein U0936_22075 [Planctomycetaceae bacterium]
MADGLTFLSSRRLKFLDGAEVSGGRLTGGVKLKLTDELDPASATRDPNVTVSGFQFVGPADIAALRPGTIVRMCPASGSHDAETTKLVHVDLADADLPWRYTPEGADTVNHKNRPWLVLVVGKAEEFVVTGGIVVKVIPEVLKRHPLEESFRWAHIQQEPGGREISRLVSPYVDRPQVTGSEEKLSPFQRYVAAIVPSFNEIGQAWNSDGDLNDDFKRDGLPVFHSWEFTTGEAGDFESIVARLKIRTTGNVGKVSLTYREMKDASGTPITMTLRGAITGLDSEPGKVSPQVTADLDVLNDPIEEPATGDFPKREIIGLPQYGQPWVEDPNSAPDGGWSKSLNEDPRYRSISGMGTWLGVEAQEELMAAGVAQAGALHEVAHRIRQLAMGVDVSSRLWNRRLPDEKSRRMEVLGPVMARIMTSGGDTVLNQVTGQNTRQGTQSPLAAAQFSSAATRLLRNGTSRTRHLQNAGSIERNKLLVAASRVPVKPERAPDGTHQAPDGIPHIEAVIEPRVESIRLSNEVKQRLARLIQSRDGHLLTTAFITEFISKVTDAGFPKPDCLRRKLQSLLNSGVKRITRGLIHQLMQGCLNLLLENQDFPFGFSDNIPPEPPDRFHPVDIDVLCGVVENVVDPRGPDSPARRRIQDTIGNFPIGDLATPELPLGLNFPAWQLLNKYAPDWLVPGVGGVEADSVLALQTNPTFVDAFMVGINTQFLAEARWRNLWIQRNFTPLRMFWGQINPATGLREADIQPIAEWAKALDKELGDKSHQVIDPRDAPGNKDLVILFRSELFRRYPGTLVYLMDKPATDDELSRVPDFSPVGAATRPRMLGPIFMGNVTADVVFFIFNVAPDDLSNFWLMLDEPPAELRLRKLPFDSNMVFDSNCVDRPTRVAMDGSYLSRLGHS